MVQRVFRQAFAICSTRAFLLPSLVVPAGLAIVQRAVAPASIPAGALGVPTPLHFSTVILAIVAPLLSLWVSASLLSLGIAVARGEVFATMVCGFILSAVFLGVWFAFFLHWTTRVPSWPMTLLAIVWFAPMGAFTTALSAALYVNLLALTRPLTRAEFFLAPTEAELPH